MYNTESIQKLWVFEAVDTLFFRDGSPYNAGEGGQSGIRGRFPPFINTVQGAIRIALASGQGWSPENNDRWPEKLGTPDNLGQVKLQGPYLMQNEKMLFPAPLFLASLENSIKGKDFYTRLKPGEEVECDLGKVRLPEPQERQPGLKLLEDCWLDLDGMEVVLNGGLPAKDQVYSHSNLWQEEYRVGIERKPDTRTVATSKIYSCSHIRLQKNVSLAVVVSGVPEVWHEKASRLVRLGGEGRLARVKMIENVKILPGHADLKQAGGKVRFTVTLATPGKYGSDTINVIKNGPPGIPGKCVSACIGKLVQAGGWDSQKLAPRPLEPFIPAGSTWFYEAGEPDILKIASIHGSTNGDPYGFGQILVGSWEV